MRAPDAPIRDQVADDRGLATRPWVVWFRQLLGFIRPRLRADQTFYVNAAGNDRNTGLSPATGGAWATLQRAIDAYEYLDTAGYDVTIQLADGEYLAGGLITSRLGGGSLTIRGNVDTPSSVILNVDDSHCIEVAGHPAGSPVIVQGMQLKTTTSGSGLKVSGGSVVHYGAVDFGACAEQHIHVTSGAVVRAIDDYAISGGAGAHWLAEQFGAIGLPILSTPVGLEVTITNTPAFSAAFARAVLLGIIQTEQLFTFTGSATGTEYEVDGNGVIDTDGAGDGYFPGDSTWAPTNGGQYL